MVGTAENSEASSSIKAVTWHLATIEYSDEGYKARIIFDI
jgi:SHS2 domain-containing protein